MGGCLLVILAVLIVGIASLATGYTLVGAILLAVAVLLFILVMFLEGS